MDGNINKDLNQMLQKLYQMLEISTKTKAAENAVLGETMLGICFKMLDVITSIQSVIVEMDNLKKRITAIEDNRDS